MSRKRGWIVALVTLGGFVVAQGGSLEPPGPPAPTMQTLAELQQNWNQLITTDRFKIVMSGEGVLDQETGLVWEEGPAGATFLWQDAVIHCYQRVAGTRLGWRLPTVEELAALIDPAAEALPPLPSGHPFLVPPYFPPGSGVAFWTMTSVPEYFGDTSESFAIPYIGGIPVAEPKSDRFFHAWCVRGGHGHD